MPARSGHVHKFRVVARVIRIEFIAKRVQVTPGNEIMRPRQGHIDGIGEIVIESQAQMGMFRLVKFLQNGRLVAISQGKWISCNFGTLLEEVIEHPNVIIHCRSSLVGDGHRGNFRPLSIIILPLGLFAFKRLDGDNRNLVVCGSDIQQIWHCPILLLKILPIHIGG
mgnify:CR=1 FL=1